MGCFAQSLISAGTRLTVPGTGANRKLPEQDIPDSHLKYCPLLASGLFLAPANFAVMSVFWYINHAREPNAVTDSWRLYAGRDIQTGEELTIYYPDLLTHPKNRSWVVLTLHV